MRKLILTAILTVTALTGCAGLSERDQRIGSGAVIGGVAGNVLGGGSAIGTVGGAVLGGLVGAEVDRHRNDGRYTTDRRYEDARRRYDECRRWNSRRYCDSRRY